MKRTATFLFAIAACLAGGCGGEVAQHPLRLIFPPQDCSQQPQPCRDYLGCYALGIFRLDISVGIDPSENTVFLCASNGPYIDTFVYYQPGHGTYPITASYVHERSGMTVELATGPFPDDQGLTPWSLPLH